MYKIEILQLGNQLLRQNTQLVTDVHQPCIQETIQQLHQAIAQYKGVGIAAPQIGKLLQILIVASHPNHRYPTAPQMKPLVMINPKIIAHSDVLVKDWEGCLSIPGIRALVPRYDRLEVEYTSSTGQLSYCDFEGFVARIFQHEYDHLQGKVFLDRLETPQDIITEQEYQKRFA